MQSDFQLKWLYRHLHEVLSLLLGGLALLLFLAFISFNPDDPGWNTTAEKSPTNLLSLPGAWFADFLFSLIGAAAWLLPFFGLQLAIRVAQRNWLRFQWQPWLPSLRFCGLLLSVSGVAALAHLHFYQQEVSWAYGAGGLLGESLSSLGYALLGHLGSTLLFLAALLTGLALATGYSWLGLMDEIGHLLVLFVEAIKDFGYQIRGSEYQQQDDEDEYDDEQLTPDSTEDTKPFFDPDTRSDQNTRFNQDTRPRGAVVSRDELEEEPSLDWDRFLDTDASSGQEPRLNRNE